MRDRIEMDYLAAKDGDRNPLQIYVEFKRTAAMLKEFIEDLEPEALEEMAEYGKGQHEIYGVLAQVKNTPSRWDFKACELVMVKEAEIKKLKNDLRAIAQTDGGEYIDSDGVIQQLPVQSFGRQIIEVKQLKQQ